MKITTTKIIRELEKKGWANISGKWDVYDKHLIKATLDIIDEILKEQKGITIKK